MLVKLVLLYLLLVNMASLFAMGMDKRAATRGQWRIAERRLFLLAALGGAAGGWLGMKLFRHKIRKRRFTLGFPLLLAWNIVSWYWVLGWFRGLHAL